MQRGALSPDVLRSVQQLHEQQRSQAAEPPAPYQRALAKRGDLPPTVSTAVVDSDGVPRPYATALRERKEGR